MLNGVYCVLISWCVENYNLKMDALQPKRNPFKFSCLRTSALFKNLFLISKNNEPDVTRRTFINDLQINDPPQTELTRSWVITGDALELIQADIKMH